MQNNKITKTIENKYVEFYSKNKFGKLAHVFGFIIRIYHYARAPERQIMLLTFMSFSFYVVVERFLNFNNFYKVVI